jgi:hypothetical protein
VRTGKAHVRGVQVVGGPGAVTQIKLYDGDAGDDPLMFDSGEIAAKAGQFFPVEFDVQDGIYADITTTGGYAFVYLK